jgi:hypothetical protein
MNIERLPMLWNRSKVLLSTPQPLSETVLLLKKSHTEQSIKSWELVRELFFQNHFYCALHLLPHPRHWKTYELKCTTQSGNVEYDMEHHLPVGKEPH